MTLGDALLIDHSVTSYKADVFLCSLFCCLKLFGLHGTHYDSLFSC